MASLWAEHMGWDLSPFDLVEMVTASPGDALSRCWGLQVGRLAAKSCADVTVIGRTTDDPFENLVLASEEQVLLVLVGGKPQYGTKELMEACGVHRTTSVSIGRVRRRVTLVDPKDKDKPLAQRAAWTWNKLLNQLEAVRIDPIGAVRAANAPNARSGRIASAVGPERNTF